MTGTTVENPLVADYLRRLDRAARSLPRAERRELLAEIRAHLHAGLGGDAAGEAEVRNALEALGEPEAIVAAARPATPARAAGAREIAAVVLLLLGGIVVPVIGWFAGALLLWSSPAWTGAQKLLGTLVLPGGLLAPLLLALVPSPVTLPLWLGLPLLAALVAAPVAVALHLARSARRPGAAS